MCVCCVHVVVGVRRQSSAPRAWSEGSAPSVVHAWFTACATRVLLISGFYLQCLGLSGLCRCKLSIS